MHNRNHLPQTGLISVRNDTGPKTIHFSLSISNPSTPKLRIFFSTGLMIFPNFNISTAERLFGTTEDAILFAVLTGNTTLCETTFFHIFCVVAGFEMDLILTFLKG